MSTWEKMTVFFDRHVQRPGYDYLEPLAKSVHQLSKNEEWNWLVPGQSMANLTLRLPQHKWPGPFIAVVATPRGLVVELFRGVGRLETKTVVEDLQTILPDYVATLQKWNT